MTGVQTCALPIFYLFSRCSIAPSPQTLVSDAAPPPHALVSGAAPPPSLSSPQPSCFPHLLHLANITMDGLDESYETHTPAPVVPAGSSPPGCCNRWCVLLGPATTDRRRPSFFAGTDQFFCCDPATTICLFLLEPHFVFAGTMFFVCWNHVFFCFVGHCQCYAKPFFFCFCWNHTLFLLEPCIFFVFLVIANAMRNHVFCWNHTLFLLEPYLLFVVTMFLLEPSYFCWSYD